MKKPFRHFAEGAFNRRIEGLGVRGSIQPAGFNFPAAGVFTLPVRHAPLLYRV